MNNKINQTKKMLIVCTSFAPRNVIGAIRLSKFAKYLKKFGWDITVLTLPINDEELIDQTLISNEIESINIIRIPHSRLYRKLILRFLKGTPNAKVNKNTSSISKKMREKEKSNKLKHLFKTKGFKLFSKVKDYSWYYESKKWIDKNIGADEFDIVLSSYPSIPAHWVAKYVRDKKLAKKWVADFRDPMAYKELNSMSEYKIKIKQQKKLVNCADAVIAVSKSLVKSIEDMLPKTENRKPVFFIPNGYDKIDYQVNYDKIVLKNNKDNSLSFAYTGGLYAGKRNIGVIFKVLRELIQEGTIDFNNILFNYAGKEFNVLKKQALEHGLESILKDHGYVTRNESINLQNNSSFNVVCTWNNGDYHGVIPGKIYESLLIHKPTIAIINGDSSGSEVADIIRSTNIGIAFEEANEAKDYIYLKQYIKEQYNNFIKNQTIIYEPVTSLVEEYDYINLTQKLQDVLFKVLQS